MESVSDQGIEVCREHFFISFVLTLTSVQLKEKSKPARSDLESNSENNDRDTKVCTECWILLFVLALRFTRRRVNQPIQTWKVTQKTKIETPRYARSIAFFYLCWLLLRFTQRRRRRRRRRVVNRPVQTRRATRIKTSRYAENITLFYLYWLLLRFTQRGGGGNELV